MLILPVLIGLASAAVVEQRSPTVLPLEDDLTVANFSSYAPISIQCPERDQWVRPAVSLSNEESIWVHGRKDVVLQGLTSYLERLNLSDFDLEMYLKRLRENKNNVPTIAMAISGGAWASALTGTGALRAVDDRFAPSVEHRTGGILQSMTYLAGLSGGSWPVISFATYNYPTIDEMVHAWNVNMSRFTADEDSPHAATFETMFKQIAPKFEAGYNISFMDLLGRAMAYEFVAGSEGGMATTLSGVAGLSNFKEHNMPLPLFQAPQLTSGDMAFYGIQVPDDNATIYEWSPFEFGAWNGHQQFFPTKYLGTKMTDGIPADSCVVGYDRAGFMIGTAAAGINFWFIEDYSNNTLGSFAKRDDDDGGAHRTRISRRIKSRDMSDNNMPLESLEAIQKGFQKAFNLTRNEAMYVNLPNPFATSESINNAVEPPANLTLVDESEILQALPLWSLVQPSRHVDFIMAWDNDEDALPYGWLNGTSLWGSYMYAKANSVPFPIIPKPATFVNRNLTLRPVFFGCDAALTTTNDTQSPIILYLTNAPYSSYTNYTEFREAFSDENMAAIMTNSFNIVTQGNSTLDSEWPECLGCAAIDRSLAKVGMQRSEQCQRCMMRYCWDGVNDDSDPGVVDPTLMLDPRVTFDKWNETGSQKGPFWAEYGT